MSNNGPKVINYESLPPRKLTLEDTGDRVRIFFPAWPKILYLFNALGISFIAFVMILTGLLYFYLLFVLSPKYPGSSPTTPDAINNLSYWELGLLGLLIGIWCIYTVLAWHYYYFWNQQYRFLWADSEILGRSWFFLWNRREKILPAKNISAIELRQARGHLWGKPRMLLYVHRHQKRPLRFYLSTTEPLLPKQIATSLARVLACELQLPQTKSISQT